VVKMEGDNPVLLKIARSTSQGEFPAPKELKREQETQAVKQEVVVKIEGESQVKTEPDKPSEFRLIIRT